MYTIVSYYTHIAQPIPKIIICFPISARVSIQTSFVSIVRIKIAITRDDYRYYWTINDVNVSIDGQLWNAGRFPNTKMIHCRKISSIFVIVNTPLDFQLPSSTGLVPVSRYESISLIAFLIAPLPPLLGERDKVRRSGG